MAASSSDSACERLSIVSVAFPDGTFLARNLALTKGLNPAFTGQWIIVDNTPHADLRIDGHAGIEILPGVAPEETHDKGSLHHALGLEKGLEHVRTRFVLFLDHDFYVIRGDWISAVLSHVCERGIGIFGAVWNPRWFYQYRDFPSVHFMLIDLDRIPAARIDLKPAIGNDRWWRLINDDDLPCPRFLRDTLKAARCRDTGSGLYRGYRDDPSVRIETLTPHYMPPDNARFRWEKRLAPLLPDSWRKYPRDSRSYATESFLRERSPRIYARGWEEFFWQQAPFAIHLRRVGRSLRDLSLDEDHALLSEFLADAPEMSRG